MPTAQQGNSWSAPWRRLALGRRDRRRGGFTLVELVIVLGIIVVVSSLLLTTVARARMAAQGARCQANLRGILGAFMSYRIDNDHRFPDPSSAGQNWEALLQPYLASPRVFECPSDSEIYTSVGSSYDWRDTPFPDTTMAARRDDTPIRSDTVLAYETLPGWHAAHKINAARLDGSVVPMDEDACFEELQKPVLRYMFSAGP